MFQQLMKINTRPKPFEHYTADTLWTDEHISRKMLELHLDENVDPASRRLTFVESSVDWLVSRFQVGPGTTVCDFGCGPGLYTTRLAQKGARVTGVDFSPRSIQYARKTAAAQNLHIDYFLGNYLEFKTRDRFDLITMIYCDLCALSPEQRQTMLSTFHDCLTDHGRVVLDVFSLEAFEQREALAQYGHRLLDGFWAPGDYYGFLNTFKYDDEKVILDKYTIVEENRTWEVYNWLQYFSPEAIAREFEENGLRILEYYGDLTGRPYQEQSQEIALVAARN